MELNVDRITKQYGPKIAVDRISLTLKPGVTGLLGAIGAGKTTLMRMESITASVWLYGILTVVALTLCFWLYHIHTVEKE